MSWNPNDVIPFHYEDIISRVFPRCRDSAERCNKHYGHAGDDYEYNQCGRESHHAGPCVNYYKTDRCPEPVPYIAFGDDLEALRIAVRLLVNEED